MRAPHDAHAKFLGDRPQSGPYHRKMINAEGSPTRTLTIVLPESDWRALRAAEPDAVAWLQARIRERLAIPGPHSDAYVPPVSTKETWLGDDEY